MDYLYKKFEKILHINKCQISIQMFVNKYYKLLDINDTDLIDKKEKRL